MTRWAMVADLERCVGCQTCTAACRHTNATSPAVQWRKVLDVEAGTFPNVSRTFVPVGCQHCADPPCMHVCPTTATGQRTDGIVTIDYDLCIGCMYCDVACPYQARFKHNEPNFAYGAKALQSEIVREDEARLGVAQKCTFCSDRIDYGIAHGLTPGVAPEATPACVNSCIADALHFGDIDDPNSNVSRLISDHRNFRMHAELETAPGFYYLYDKADRAESAAPTAGATPAAGKIRTRGVEPWHQQHWDWKAAGNFTIGGAGAGLFAVSALAAFYGAALFPSAWLGAAMVALGLFFVLLKIGRPMRAAYVLLQPKRSWMSREAWVAAAFFPSAALAVWFGGGVLVAASGLLAALFLFCQAMILKEARGIPAWREPRIVPLIVATGLAEGAGLFLALAMLAPVYPWVANAAAVGLLVLMSARYAAWHFYLGALRSAGAPAKALDALDQSRPWFVILGHVLPTGLVVLGLLLSEFAGLLYAAAGLAAFAGGFGFKFILVTRAGFNQGFALTRTPVRGSGAAGPAVKPGWSSHVKE